jgi:hypothetical protein
MSLFDNDPFSDANVTLCGCGNIGDGCWNIGDAFVDVLDAMGVGNIEADRDVGDGIVTES